MKTNLPRTLGFAFLALLGVFGLIVPARAAEVHVAVASNFSGTFEKLATDFTTKTGHKAIFSLGSTGKFYAQIKNGAPFEVLLAADDETPKRLVVEGLGVAESEFTYARGKLVLWSAKPGFIDNKGAVLTRSDLTHIAVCDSKLAPYGRAAEETLRALKLYDQLKAKLVIAENISQAHQFVATGNADLGFVALSQVAVPGKPKVGSYWLVPEELYSPLQQDAVLLKRGESNPAARALLEFLKSDGAKERIRSYGYEL
jgi:molybdate transport system substrate-binding protein